MILIGFLVCIFSGILFSVFSLFFLLCLVIRRINKKRLNNYETTRNIAVLVVGDIGRSPRMQNHALCISKRFCSKPDFSGKSNKLLKRSSSKDSFELDDKINNNHVYLVGYNDTTCSSAITGDKNITLLGIGKTFVDQHRKILPLWAFLSIKVVEQSLRIFITIMQIPNLSGILLQVPPSIPSIPIALFVSFIRGAPLIIDWHNYGHTLLIKDEKRVISSSILKRIYQHIFVTSYKILEFTLGRLSDSAFCVSKAMQEDLSKRGIQATVVYDRPNADFKPLDSVSKRHSILLKYFGSLEDDICLEDYNLEKGYTQETPLIRKTESEIKQRKKSKENKKFTQKNQKDNTKTENVTIYDGSSFTDVQDIVSGALNRSVLDIYQISESIKLSKERIKSSTRGSLVSECLIEEEFFLKMEPKVLDEISSNFKNQNLSDLLSRDDLFFDNHIIETSPVTELGISRVQSGEISLKVQLKKNRPVILVTSTSWTPDEDLNLLLEGLLEYDVLASKQINNNNLSEQLPDIFLIITGKGPDKKLWLEEASKSRMKHVKIRTVFVEADDYPKLLASSDLGVSMHYSSSGLDLPMKVVDMLGAGIPIIYFSYPTMNELLKNEKLELFFSSSQELCSRLTTLLKGFNSSPERKVFPSPNLNRILKSNNLIKETFYQEWNNSAVYHFDEMVI
ncbi:beta-mannosyltransferase [Cryptosporidium ubiquitum]|uniref:Beta-mannosyltransferase n=1 Tax=Cryptosporidium ubiquitum TaxID=857276 RepID=A0A1J4MIJ6_9CRYT|nr:beta-mannosyltransferase [Cryptosporidium ubiquitum]OII74057.1 beta-mannosyltransferase [Cryptosporidium ubiquitum]